MTAPHDDPYAGSVFGAMRAKDPELFATLGNLDVYSAMERWVEKYPDDFPERGMTDVADTTAIKPIENKA